MQRDDAENVKLLYCGLFEQKLIEIVFFPPLSKSSNNILHFIVFMNEQTKCLCTQGR